MEENWADIKLLRKFQLILGVDTLILSETTVPEKQSDYSLVSTFQLSSELSWVGSYPLPAVGQRSCEVSNLRCALFTKCEAPFGRVKIDSE
jgi:hypothetical protein